MVRTGVTFAEACGEWPRSMKHDLDRKPSTLVQYRSSVRARFVPAFGDLRLEDVTAERIDAWKAALRLSNRTQHKLLTELNGVFVRARRAYKLPHNPVADGKARVHASARKSSACAPGCEDVCRLRAPL